MNITKVNVRVTYADESIETREFPVIDGTVTVKARDFLRTIHTIDILADEFTAKAGDEGYFIVPNIAPGDDNHASAQVFFRERENARNVFMSSTMNVYAACHGESSVLAICEKMQHEYSLVVAVTDGDYLIYPRFHIREAGMYEDIVFRYISVESSNWCDIARAYRIYQLNRGACRTLRERIDEGNEVLEKALRGIEVRCRLAHKKGFPNIPEQQTPENEPDINIEVPFSRLKDVADKLLEKGCKDISFCLVGWNIGGQDGRDPQYFPVDPRLGGEGALRDAIKHIKELGYLISAHTDPIIAFNIADNLDHKDIKHTFGGKEQTWALCSGGRSFVLCDKQSYEQYVLNYTDKLKDIGFYGLHYYDVLTILKPWSCYNPAHPLNKKQVVEYRNKMLDHAREVFGGSASEGGFDFAIGHLDYAMYPVIKYPVDKLPETCDNTIPFWFIVYHGIILYNAFPKTVNAMLKDPSYWLLGIEFGARPLAYLHGRTFEYDGEPNFLCTTDEQLERNATLIGEEYKRYMGLVDLQYEFFEDYKILKKGVVYTRYSNDTVVIVNHSDEDYVYEGKTIGALSYLRIDK